MIALGPLLYVIELSSWWHCSCRRRVEIRSAPGPAGREAGLPRRIRFFRDVNLSLHFCVDLTHSTCASKYNVSDVHMKLCCQGKRCGVRKLQALGLTHPDKITKDRRNSFALSLNIVKKLAAFQHSAI